MPKDRDRKIGIALIVISLVLAALTNLNKFSLNRQSLSGNDNRPDGASINSSWQESEKIINYLNQLRISKGIKPIIWDDRAYSLAVARSKDMNDNGYTAFTNPKTKECAASMKAKFSFSPQEVINESFYYYYYPLGGAGQIRTVTMESVINNWLEDSKGNLKQYIMSANVSGGAIGCKGSVCSFISTEKGVLQRDCI